MAAAVIEPSATRMRNCEPGGDCSMVVTTYFATCDEYMRTMLGVLPALYMMGAMLLQTVADACRKRCATRKEKPQ